MLSDFFVHHEYPLQTLLVLAFCGITLGELFERFKLPDISGQLLAGILLGPAVFGVLGADALHHVELLSQLVLGMMTFMVGTHLNQRMLHNAWKRVLGLVLAESLTAFALVYFLMSRTQHELGLAPLLACIAISTAPGAIISLIQRKKARGTMVKTLLGMVALNNVIAVLFFEIFKSRVISQLSGETLAPLAQLSTALAPVAGSIMIGIATGFLFTLLARHLHSSGKLFVLGMLLVFTNLSIAHDYSLLSGLLINLSAGVVLGNYCYHTKRMLQTFDHLNELLYPLFFTLAGTHLDPALIKESAGLVLLFVGARATAKIGAVKVAASVGKLPKKIGNYLGVCLLPESGLAIGLVISLGAIPAFADTELLKLLTTTVLGAVAINELIGPLGAMSAFNKAGETGQANPRLIDFLHEEFILMPLDAKNKWDAIEQMCEFLVKSHNYKQLSAQELYSLAEAREKECTTGMGRRLALPHIRLPYKGNELIGVIGITKEPLDFESLDGNPVRMVILLLTPEGKQDQHIKVFASIGKIFTSDPSFQERILRAHSPAEVYDILQSKEVREMNYFLEAFD